MSKQNKSKRIVAGLLVLAAAGAGTGVYLNSRTTEVTVTSEAEQSYKEETVQYGTVASGITESGSVSFGSLDQEFSLAEITDVSSSSSSSSDTGTSQGSSMGTSGSMQGNSMSGQSGTMQGSTASSSGSSSSSSSSVSLEVEEVYVTTGQVVSAGDPVLKISEESIEEYRSEMEAAVETAKLNVKQEEINVETKQAEADYTYQMYLAKGKTAEETYEATITSLENAVADLEEELQESADAVAEYESELEAGSDVEDELEEEQLNYSTIEANLQIARNNLTTGSIEAKQTYDTAMTNYQYADQLYEIDTNGMEDDLNDAKDTLQEAEDALAAFEEQIGDGTVYAEYSGTILSLGCSAGDTLTDEMVVATYADPDNVTMAVSVSQEDISQITVGNAVELTLTAYGEESFPGEVSSIATSATVGSSTVNYEVTVRFTGDVDKVYADMTGEATFVEKEAQDVLCISNKAVHQDGTRSWVKVLEADGSTTETTIETGFSNGTKVEVLSGLNEGDIVLIESQVAQ